MRFCGNVGFVNTTEQSPGVYLPVTTERKYIGDVLRNTTRWDPNSETVNDDLKVNHRVSVVADSYMDENLGFMKYVVLNGVKWRIVSLSIERPRIMLELGEMYNE